MASEKSKAPVQSWRTSFPYNFPGLPERNAPPRGIHKNDICKSLNTKNFIQYALGGAALAGRHDKNHDRLVKKMPIDLKDKLLRLYS